MSEPVRERCRGVARLDARLEPWMEALCDDPDQLASLLDHHGSPVNLLHTDAFVRNAAELRAAAAACGVDLDLFFARKANKALTLVDSAHQAGLGLDLAGERELEQCLARGVPGNRLMMTAAIKPRSLLHRCLREGVTVAVDNLDELDLLVELAGAPGVTGSVALRLAPDLDRPPTRFGFTAAAARAVGERLAAVADVAVEGVHFHVDGYDAGDRVRALEQSLTLADALRAQGHPVTFVDMGGGVPMRYVDSSEQWDGFWGAQEVALRGEAEPLTFEGHRLGPVYPAYQEPVRAAWLAQVLRARIGGDTVADALNRRNMSLRIEPGRCLMDGVGLTAARVQYRKQREDGTWLVGLAMNRTQCRSAADDFLVDPILVHPAGAGRPGPPVEAYLVGAYCIERELLTWRRLVFDHGVAVGDVVAFPNTAGYFMHILESASHQIPLARNLVSTSGGFELDPIDLLDSAPEPVA